jgi:hypothetical protein
VFAASCGELGPCVALCSDSGAADEDEEEAGREAVRHFTRFCSCHLRPNRRADHRSMPVQMPGPTITKIERSQGRLVISGPAVPTGTGDGISTISLALHQQGVVHKNYFPPLHTDVDHLQYGCEFSVCRFLVFALTIMQHPGTRVLVPAGSVLQITAAAS